MPDAPFPFTARDAALAHLRRLWAEEGCCTIHVHGPTGSGKTRLLHALRTEFPTALYFGWGAEGASPWPALDAMVAAACERDLLLDSPDVHLPDARLDAVVAAAAQTGRRVVITTQMRHDLARLFASAPDVAEIALPYSRH